MKTQKFMWHNIMRSTKSQKVSVLHYSIDVKHKFFLFLVELIILRHISF